MAAIPSLAMVVAVAALALALIWLAGLARPGSIPEHLTARAEGLARTAGSFQRQHYTWAAGLVVLGALALAGWGTIGQSASFLAGASAAVLIGSGAVLATSRAAVSSVTGWIEDLEADDDAEADDGYSRADAGDFAAGDSYAAAGDGYRVAAAPPPPPPAPRPAGAAPLPPPPAAVGPVAGPIAPLGLVAAPVARTAMAVETAEPAIRPVVVFRPAEEERNLERSRRLGLRRPGADGSEQPPPAPPPAPPPEWPRGAAVADPVDQPLPVRSPAGDAAAGDAPAGEAGTAGGPGGWTGPLGLGPVVPVVRGAAVIGLGAAALALGGVTAVVMVLVGAGSRLGPGALGSFGLGLALLALLARVGSGLVAHAARPADDPAGADPAHSWAPTDPSGDPLTGLGPGPDDQAHRGPTGAATVVVAQVVGSTVDRVASYAGGLLAPVVLCAFALGITPGPAGRPGRILLFLPLVVALTGLLGSALVLALVPDGAADAGRSQRRWITGTGTSVLVTLAGTVLAGLWLCRGPGFGQPLGPAVAVVGGVLIGWATSQRALVRAGAGRGGASALIPAVVTVVLVGLGLYLAYRGGQLTVGPDLAGLDGLDPRGFAGFYGLALGAVGLLAPTAGTLARDLTRPIGLAAEALANLDGGPDDADDLAWTLAPLDPDLDVDADRAGDPATDEPAPPGDRARAPAGAGRSATAAGALSTLALVGAFELAVRAAARAGGHQEIALNLGRVVALLGLLAGLATPLLLVSLALGGARRVTGTVAAETARQDQLVPELRHLRPGVLADPQRWMTVAAGASLREALALGLLGAVVPAVIGLLSLGALSGFLAGAVTVGLALTTVLNLGVAAAPLATATGLRGPTEPGPAAGTGLLATWVPAPVARRAAEVAAALGDPRGDVAAPCLISLVRLMALVSLVLAPAFVAAA